MSCNRSAIDAHFDADLSPDGERAMRAHLTDCDACRAYYQRHLLLSRLNPGARSAEERIAAGLGLRRRRRWLALPVLAAAAAAAALVLALRAPDGMTSRGRPAAVESSLAVVVASRQPPLPVASGARIRAADELAFSYRNPEGWSQLMIFGVDEHQHVYWYFPAWLDAADDPRSVPIERGADARTLGEAVAHSLDGKRLQIHGLFTRRPLSVKEVEARIKKGAVAAPDERDVLVAVEVGE